MKFKKKFIFFVIMLIVILNACSILRNRNHSIDVSGNIINNNYNNYKAGGNLCRINNKLYFNYQKNGSYYGLIEISTDSTKNIYNDGFVLKDNIELNNRFFNYNNNIYIVNDGIRCFNLEKQCFSKYVEIDLDNDYSLQDVCIVDDNNILYTTISQTSYEVLPVASKLFLYDKNSNKSSIIINKDIIGFCEKDNKIYYVTYQDEKYQLFEYDMNLRKDLIITDLPGYDSNGLMVDDNNLLFNVIKYYEEDDYFRNNLYILNLNNNYVQFDLVYSCKDYYYNYNIYDNAVYVCTEKGLIKFDSGGENVLYDKSCSECYIVDDKWVYFIDSSSNLWRVTQDGDILEKVYG